MAFSSTIFLFIFLPLAVLGYYNPWLKSQKFRNGFLLLVSLGFYGWGEPAFVFLMLCSIIVTWRMGMLIGKYREKGKLVLSIAVTYHISVFFIFKYLGFVLQQIELLFFHSETERGAYSFR